MGWAGVCTNRDPYRSCEMQTTSKYVSRMIVKFVKIGGVGDHTKGPKIMDITRNIIRQHGYAV